MARSFWSPFPAYVSAAEKRARAAADLARLAKAAGKRAGKNGKNGRNAGGARAPEPVVLDGRKIATTFWGKAWCENLESYADFAHRLERGRSYVRAGAVVDLQIGAGRIDARVSGSELYAVEISIDALDRPRWKAIAKACAGGIGSLVGLLRGQLPDEVLRAVTDRQKGLFPEPRRIHMSCSCPDWAGVCKHVAASLYGVGARLDARPELLFVLRGVDPQDLVHEAAEAVPATASGGRTALGGGATDLGAMFGIELADEPAAEHTPARASAKMKRGRRPGPGVTTKPAANGRTRRAQRR